MTFGAGLLLKEDIESYVWFLESFKKAMIFEPKVIVTDQDGAMKYAIEYVFPSSLHRLCMWHIMKKLHAKTTEDVSVGDQFKEKLNKIVWSNVLEPVEFEA